MTEAYKSIPEEFGKIVKDFSNDLKTTFPEYVSIIDGWSNDDGDINFNFVFDFCQNKFPPRFLDILYQNEDIFKEDIETDTEFLPNIHFKNLWNCDISEKTKNTIWKYLQLIMFSIIGTLNNKDAFGDTAKMFESINVDDFKTKLEETISNMQGLFNADENVGENLGQGFNMPDATKIQEHITGMLDGKLGQFAREIAEETAANLNIDFDGASDMKDIFQKLANNPSKLMGLVKTVGDKLDTKIKSGELKESELISEATEMLNKMKNMPGMDNIQSLLSKMGMGNLSGLGGKVNTGAMEENLKQKMKMAKTKERIRAKAISNAKAKLEQQLLEQAKSTMQPAVSEEEIIKIFSTGEEIERTPRGTKPQNNKKKKNKK